MPPGKTQGLEIRQRSPGTQGRGRMAVAAASSEQQGWGIRVGGSPRVQCRQWGMTLADQGLICGSFSIHLKISEISQ